jgi:hypothetical protein
MAWRRVSTKAHQLTGAKLDNSGKADEKSDLLTAHVTQNARTLNQDRMKQVELEKNCKPSGRRSK